jgi:hypothetical protein
MTFLYRITLNLFFIHKENSFESCGSNTNDESALNSDEIDKFMKGNMPRFEEPRYLYYAQSVAYGLTCGNNLDIADDQPFDIDYEEGGILKFTIELCHEETLEDLKRKILMDSFEDTMMEGELGNECLVPSREKHPIKIEIDSNMIPIHCIDYYELGHIDCRESHAIRVEKI